MEISEIREILLLMKEHELEEFQLERDGVKLTLKKGGRVEHSFVPSEPRALPAPSNSHGKEGEISLPPVDCPSPETKELKKIESPMVGTFYRSPSPESDPFVKVGDIVDEETTVCIIEAMKVMNEIKAEVKGRIERILVDDASPIQFGEPMFAISPA